MGPFRSHQDPLILKTLRGGDAAAPTDSEKNMMWGYNGLGYGGFGGFGMGIGMLLFWGLIIAVIFLLVRGFGSRSGGNEARPRERTALDILGERYARGEIGKAEFEEKRRDLSAVQ